MSTADQVRSTSLMDDGNEFEHPLGGEQLKALIFDVDGTLYEQCAVRRAMFFRLLRAYCTTPRRGLLILRALQAYRRAQEALRANGRKFDDIAKAQVQLAAQQTGMKEEFIAAAVIRWMQQEALPAVAAAVRKGIPELLQKARNTGLQLAAVSDYPAHQKLAVMGLADFFDIVVTAQDLRVQRFKPDPASLEVALRQLGVRNSEAIYIGDRLDVDAVAASRAGIKHFVLDRTHTVAQLSRLIP
jgi:HAD superfamily hydrolase (TIGR01549 family)